MFLSKKVFTFLGFFILYVSHKSKVSLSSIRIDRLFKLGVQPFASNEALKNVLKSFSNITWLSIFSKLDDVAVSSLRTLT